MPPQLSQIRSGDALESAALFSRLADVLDGIGTRASAITLNGPLNHLQKNDLLSTLQAIDVLKQECSSQATKILRAERARSEN